jgi:hypothetical protein
MQISELSLMAFLAGAAALQLRAQPASAEQQNRALEVLRQAMSQEHQSATMAPQLSPPATEGMATPPAPALGTTSWSLAVAGSSDQQQQQALMLLRQQMAEQQSTTPSAATKSTKSRSSSKATTAKKANKSSSSESVAQPSVDIVAPVVPLQPTGPKTKQQQLMELLEQYKADKITPAEYQTQRARILSEP